MKKRVIGLGAAAVLAILGTVLIVSRVDDASRREAAGQELATVLVMNEFVPAGTPAEQLVGFVRTDGVPASLVTAGAVGDLADLAGLVTTSDLMANEQVTAGRFSTAAEAARIGSVEVPSDMVELSVAVTPEQSVGGAIQPGETVSVVATFDAGEQPVNSVGLLRAQVLVTRVQGVDPVAVDAAAATDGTATPAPTADSLITIAVPTADAERFIYAIAYGQLYLAREPIDPDEFIRRVATAENVFARDDPTMSTVVILSDTSELAAVLASTFPHSSGHDLVSIDSALDGPVQPLLKRIRDHDADAVVIEPGLRMADGLALAGAIENDQPELSLVLVAEPTPQVLSQAMRVGVREVVPPLSISKELGPAVARAADVVKRRRAAVIEASEAGERRIIAVISPKGGAGKTVVATNLAVGLARQHPGKVVLIDADLQFGDVDTALRLQPETTIVDAVRAGISNVTELKLHLEAHATGLFVLAAPARPGEADEVGGADLGKAIDLLSEEFPFVVIDTDGGIGERTLTVLEQATDHVFICATDVPAVRGLSKTLEALDLIGITGQRRHFVLNRADARVGLDNDDIAVTVGIEFDVKLPSCREVTFSVNEGIPILSADEPTPITRPLLELVERFSPTASTPQGRRSRFGRRG